MDIHKFMKPVSSEVVDTHVRGDDLGWVQTDRDGNAFMKVLWTSAQSGGWAVLLRWKKGFKVPAHKHLGAIHAYIIRGRLKLRDTVLEAGDYLYEANGMIHQETEALEETLHLNIADGPLLFFDGNNFTSYLGWEQVEQAGARANATGGR